MDMFKENWDITLPYIGLIFTFLIVFLFLKTCSDFGCLGGVIIAIMGISFSVLLTIVGIWRTLLGGRNKMRLLWYIPLTIIVIFLINGLF